MPKEPEVSKLVQQLSKQFKTKRLRTHQIPTAKLNSKLYKAKTGSPAYLWPTRQQYHPR